VKLINKENEIKAQLQQIEDLKSKLDAETKAKEKINADAQQHDKSRVADIEQLQKEVNRRIPPSP
jgi:hypothetical protein